MLKFYLAYSKVITSIKGKGRKIQDIVFGPLAKLLKRFNLSANFISFISMILILLSAVLLYQGDKLYLLTLLSAIVLDMLDGTLARLYPLKESGALFDYFSDRFSDAILILGLTAAGLLDYYLALGLLFTYVVATLSLKALENVKLKVYLLSYRIITMGALLVNEIHPQTLYYISILLLVNYTLAVLISLPQMVFHKN